MTFISYAQNFEDVMLWRALKHVDKGFYIDVGANDPQIDSVTKAFYDRGWHGINIEPVSEWYEKLQKDRPHDINLKVAAGARKGNNNFYVIPGTGISTSNKSFAEQHARVKGYVSKKIKVPVVSLTAICEQYVPSVIHFLKIDVEGAEKAVLQGLNLNKFRPWILLIESNLPNSIEQAHEKWEKIVLNACYDLAYVDGLNRFYVDKEHSKLLDALYYPPNVFDDFIRSEQINSELRAQHAEVLAIQSNARTQKAEAKTQAAETKMAQANEHADRSEILAIQANARAEKAEAKTQAAETKMAQANEHADRSEIFAIQANARAEKAEAKMQAAETKMVRANQRADRSQTLLIQANQRIEQAEIKMKVLEAKKNQADEYRSKSEEIAKQANVRAENAERAAHNIWIQYQTVVNSRTWRMTFHIRGVIKWGVKWFTSSSVTCLNLVLARRTWLKAWVKRLRYNKPVCEMPLALDHQEIACKEKLSDNMLVGSPLCEDITCCDELSDNLLNDLSPRARKIYANLILTMPNQGEN